MIKAVIFDFDDTLVKTHVVKWQQHKAVAKEVYGSELSDEELREHWGKPFDALLTALHKGVDTLENIKAAYVSRWDKFLIEIQDDTKDVLRTLLERGIKIGVVTAMDKEYVLKDFKRFDVPVEQFFCLQGANETAFHKPDPRVFEPVLEQLGTLGIKKEETVYVGDSLSDLKASRGAGMDFIAVTTGLHAAEEFKKEGASKIIMRLGELPDVLNG